MNAVAPNMSLTSRLVTANMWLIGPVVKSFLARTRETNALVRTTTAPTLFQSGVKDNVLSTRARAVVNFRILPGDSIATVLRHVQAVVDDPRVSIRALRGADPSPVSDVNSPAYALLSRTIHEVMPEAFPRRSLWTRRPLYRRSARRAKLVLTDSLSSKRDIERAYGVTDERVLAIPLGVGDEFRNVADEEQARIREGYGFATSEVVLFVGKFSRRRNVPTLVRAFAELRRAHDVDALLVLAGDDHLGLELVELARELGIADSVRIPGHVPDSDLPGLYAAATMFAYPSDYEGFGLPVVEAMAAGTAVITLDNSALREVADGAALVLPEATVAGLAEAMWRLVDDTDLRQELARRGEARSRSFSWPETARKTITALARVAAGD